MAYGLKYQSASIYTITGKECTVKLYVEDYGGGASTIRIQSVSITNNYQDEDTCPIGTGAKVVFINEGDFSDYDDLLANYEKQVKVKIEWDSQVVFEGFLICDLNEQTLLPNATIILQFTNYLKRLEYAYLDALASNAGRVTLVDCIKEALELTGLEYPLYVNSSLFETNQEAGSDLGGTFLEQTLVECDLFWINADEYDNAYMVLQKILQAFDAFLYMWDEKWIIERWDNIVNEGNWVYFPFGESWVDGIATTSLKESANRQNADFKYLNTSQSLQYKSGVNTLKLNLNDELFSTLVFNNYTAGMDTVADDPSIDDITLKTWYVHEDVIDLSVGYAAEREISYLLWQVGAGIPAVKLEQGLWYKYTFQRNEYDSDEAKTTMIVDYMHQVVHGQGEYPIVTKVRITFTLQIKYDGTVKWVYPDVDGVIHAADGEEKEFTMVYQLSGEDPAWGSAWRNRVTSIDLSEIWDDISDTDTVEFLINFKPFEYYSTIEIGWFVSSTCMIGNIRVYSSTPGEVDNEIESTLNQSFLKTKDIEMELFDLDNLNYKNGLFLADDTHTELWNDGVDSADIPLTDILIKSKYNRHCQTTKKLPATIRCDKYLKPFTLITDDNINDGESAPTNTLFLLTHYQWDLINAEYKITADEFPDEDIILSE